jgi:hypothetical protein
MISALVNPERAGASMLAQFNAFERRGAGSAPVLVARDVAAVGLNLQFSQDLIFYDVPWQVGLAEQWIGRLDRLGQRGRELRVHVLTHPDSPVKELVDLYIALKLFDASSRRTTELDERISSLISKADSDEVAWSDVLAQAKRLLDEDASSDADQAIDLQISDARLDASPERENNSRVVRALGRVGFTVEEEGTRFELRWPRATKQDVVDLPEVRSHLRPYVRAIGGRNNTPEDQAANSEQVEQERVLRVEANRLSDTRWVRGSAVDFLTPRHPLIAATLDELSADPTLCLGAFRVRRPRAMEASGVFVLALTSTFPAASGATMVWDARALAPSAAMDPSEDEELRQFFVQIEGGLRRAFTLAFPPRTEVRGWRVGSTASDSRVLAVDAVTTLRETLGDGTRIQMSDSLASSMKRLLAAAERRPEDETAHQRAAPIMERALRHVRLVGASIIREREARVAAVGRDAALRGIADHHQRRLDVAREFFRRLEGQFGRDSRVAAEDVATPRVLAAAWLEVQ